MLDNSFEFVIGQIKNRPEPLIYAWDEVKLYIKSKSQKSIPLISIGNNYDLILDGSFYLRNTKSISSKKNLDALCAIIDKKSGTLSIEDEIGGGLYNLIIIEKTKKKIVIISDVIGSFPLFTKNYSEYKKLSGNQFNLAERSDINDNSIIEFLKYGYLPFSDSFFHSVARIKPSSRTSYSSSNGELIKTEIIRYVRYSKIEDRSRNLSDNAKKVIDCWDRYFDRIGSEKILIGLSGGYDSRVVASFLRKSNIGLLNFGDPQSSETQLALSVVKKLRKKLEIASFPSNIPASYCKKLKEITRVPQSLELSHVYYLGERAVKSGSQYYGDGFLGDVVLGGSYFFNEIKSIKGIIRHSRINSQIASEKESIAKYKAQLYSLKGCLKDDQLLGLTDDSFRNYIGERIEKLIDEDFLSVECHEDMVEYLNLYLRGARLIAGGPVHLFERGLSLIVPFFDLDFLSCCFHSEKKLLIFNRLYNEIWKRKFPEIARIRKAGQGGLASNTPFIYELKYYCFVFVKKAKGILKRFFPSVKREDETYFSNKEYLENHENTMVFQEILFEKDSILPKKLNRYLDKVDRTNPELFMRYITILFYMKGIEGITENE